jgi:hypothetical protein
MPQLKPAIICQYLLDARFLGHCRERKKERKKESVALSEPVAIKIIGLLK